MEMTEQAQTLFKDSGMNAESAQKFIDYHAQAVKELQEGPVKLWDEMQAKWQSEVRADKDIGGDKLDATVQTVSKALDRFGAPGIREALVATGAGNNPAIIKTLHNMASKLVEGGHVGGAPPKAKPRTAAEAIYPNLVPADRQTG